MYRLRTQLSRKTRQDNTILLDSSNLYVLIAHFVDWLRLHRAGNSTLQRIKLRSWLEQLGQSYRQCISNTLPTNYFK